MKIILIILFSVALAIFIAAFFVEDKEPGINGRSVFRPLKRWALGGLVAFAVLLLISMRAADVGHGEGPASGDEPACASADSTVVLASFETHGVTYPLRYDAATGKLVLSEDYGLLRQLMAENELIAVFVGSSGHLASARQISSDNGAIVYVINGERYRAGGSAADERALLRKWRRAGIRFIVPEAK